MQDRSYQLLRWISGAVTDGFIQFETAHHYATLPEAMEAWIREHYLNIPERARVATQMLPVFSAFFSTYLTNSFDLLPAPGKRLNATHGRCFCPCCAILVDAPHLKAKKLKQADKRGAQKLRESAVRQIAIDRGAELLPTQVEDIANEKTMIEPVSLVAYAMDLRLRMQGIARGPAVLALWRGFAWAETGAPKKGFKLSVDAILESEQQVCDAILLEIARCG